MIPNPLFPLDREALGRVVREEWIAWAKEQAQIRNVKSTWLTPWEELSEPDKEVDRRIGERLVFVAKANSLDALRMADDALVMARNKRVQLEANLQECRRAAVSLNRDVEGGNGRVSCTAQEWAHFIDRIEAATKQFA